MTRQPPHVAASVSAIAIMILLCACARDTSPPASSAEASSAISSCGSGTSRPFDQAPVNGNPFVIASSGATAFEAEYFNCGGEGQGYHDTTTTSNPGQTFRADEGVEIIA